MFTQEPGHHTSWQDASLPTGGQAGRDEGKVTAWEVSGEWQVTLCLGLGTAPIISLIKSIALHREKSIDHATKMY